MKKVEMSHKNQEDRQSFLRILGSARWDVETWDQLLDNGVEVTPESEARYAGPVFDLHLEYYLEQSYLILEKTQREGEVFLRLHLYPKNDVASVLVPIIMAQDTIDGENFVDLVKLLITLCEPLLIETDKGLQRLL